MGRVSQARVGFLWHTFNAKKEDITDPPSNTEPSSRATATLEGLRQRTRSNALSWSVGAKILMRFIKNPENY